jgi:hypothetical protein
MKELFFKPANLYIILVLVLIISKLLLQDLWLSDQLIIYNFLSLLMITLVISLIFNKKTSFIKYFPLVILAYAFFNPMQLKTLFFISHTLILLLVVWLIIRRDFDPFIKGKIDTTIIPLEIMIIFFFL